MGLVVVVVSVFYFLSWVSINNLIEGEKLWIIVDVDIVNEVDDLYVIVRVLIEFNF